MTSAGGCGVAGKDERRIVVIEITDHRAVGQDSIDAGRFQPTAENCGFPRMARLSDILLDDPAGFAAVSP